MTPPKFAPMSSAGRSITSSFVSTEDTFNSAAILRAALSGSNAGGNRSPLRSKAKSTARASADMAKVIERMERGRELQKPGSRPSSVFFEQSKPQRKRPRSPRMSTEIAPPDQLTRKYGPKFTLRGRHSVSRQNDEGPEPMSPDCERAVASRLRRSASLPSSAFGSVGHKSEKVDLSVPPVGRYSPAAPRRRVCNTPPLSRQIGREDLERLTKPSTDVTLSEMAPLPPFLSGRAPNIGLFSGRPVTAPVNDVALTYTPSTILSNTVDQKRVIGGIPLEKQTVPRFSKFASSR